MKNKKTAMTHFREDSYITNIYKQGKEALLDSTVYSIVVATKLATEL